MLDGREISFKAGQKYLLHPVSLEFAPGCFHVIMGANGAGKSTLLRLLAGDQAPSSGHVFLHRKELGHYSKKDLATRRAVLSQDYHIAFPIRVLDMVMMGRYPYFSSNPSAEDLLICRKAMELMQVEGLSERDYHTLSGGEAQKVQMSRVLSQIWGPKEGEEKILFLDEPVSHLDVRFQHQLLRAAKNLCRQHTTVIAILHDINLAMAFADRVLFMKEGRLLYDIRKTSEITPAIIREVFEVHSSIIYPEGHRPVVIFEKDE